jgi:hypothetical protein
MPKRKKNGKQWKAVSVSFSDALGVKLPTHQPEGGVFLINPDKNHTSVISKERFIECLTRVLESTGSGTKDGGERRGDLLNRVWRLTGTENEKR